MSLLGDVIVGFRDLAPDPCQSLAPLTIANPAASYQTAQPTLFAANANVYVQATQGTYWGESAGSNEIILTQTQPFNFTLTLTTSFLATYVRVYFSVAGSGAEDQYVEISIPTPASTVTVTVSPGAVIAQGVPPTISRAWLPDSDGQILSASRIYQWINEGQKLIGNLTGGVRDITGIPSTQGQANYQLINHWLALDANFYDGYPFAAGTKQQIFRRNNATGIAGTGTVNVSADRQSIEIWPQSSRSAGQAMLSAAVTSTASVLPIYFSSGWVLGFGLLLLGTYPPTASTGANSCELVYYSQFTGTSVTQIMRGLGGTNAQAWPANTPVRECNVYFSGKRVPQSYLRGQSANTFTDPPAYEEALKQYLLYRFKDAEQNVQEAQAKYQLVEKICADITSTQQPMKPRQIQIGGTGGVETAVGLGSPFGGVILT